MNCTLKLDQGIEIPASRTDFGSGASALARTAPSGSSVLFPSRPASQPFVQSIRNAGRIAITRKRTMSEDGEDGVRVWVTDKVCA